MTRPRLSKPIGRRDRLCNRSMPESFAAGVAARVRRARESAGVSQAQVAEALGISQAGVSNLESGSRPLRVQDLYLLSKLLGRELDYFLAPVRSSRGPVGVTLRATVAELALPDLREAVESFLDEVEDEPLPDADVSVKATKPIETAERVRKATGQKKPPVDVEQIARALGVCVYRWPFPEALSALILRHGEHAIIGVNTHQASARQRFSIAHELGHFVLHHRAQHFIEYGVGQAVDGEHPNYDWQNERDANAFAAELLMPERHVRRDAAELSLTRLARRYKVSHEAMSFRLANLGL